MPMILHFSWKKTICYRSFDCFSKSFLKVSRLKPNTSQCEIVGTGDLKGANMALFGMQCIDLKKDSLKILGEQFLYNKKLEQEKFF